MADLIISRAAARAQGLKRYFTGKPCKNLHIAERAAGTGLCVECKKAFDARWYQENKGYVAAYTKRRRAENPEKVKGWRRGYYQNNKEHVDKKSRAWQRAHPEKTAERTRKWRAENPEKFQAQWLRQRAANPEAAREKEHRWRAKDPERTRQIKLAIEHNRRARKLAAPGTHTAADLADILRAQKHRCAYCRVDLRTTKKHLDHFMPLALGGSNDRANLQYLCGPCNMSKGAKDPIAFAQMQGWLL